MPDSGGDPPQVGVRAGLRLCRGGCGRGLPAGAGVGSCGWGGCRWMGNGLARGGRFFPAAGTDNLRTPSTERHLVGIPIKVWVGQPYSGWPTPQLVGIPTKCGRRIHQTWSVREAGCASGPGYAATVGRTTLVDADRLALASRQTGSSYSTRGERLSQEHMLPCWQPVGAMPSCGVAGPERLRLIGQEGERHQPMR